MTIPDLDDFRLVGGTALSLQQGHRVSEDIDLFSGAPFNNEMVLQALDAYLFPRGPVDVRTYAFGFFCTIEEVKTDFMHWGDAFVEPPVVIDNIRMASPLEIFAMKLQAIGSRKVKKDFFDIALLLNHYTIAEALDVFARKFPYDDPSVPLKQLVYMEPAENTPDPQMLNGVLWTDVKEKIIGAVKAYWQQKLEA